MICYFPDGVSFSTQGENLLFHLWCKLAFTLCQQVLFLTFPNEFQMEIAVTANLKIPYFIRNGIAA